MKNREQRSGAEWLAHLPLRAKAQRWALPTWVAVDSEAKQVDI